MIENILFNYKPYVISGYINAITSLFIGLIIALNNPHNKINRSFGYFAFNMSIWSFIYILFNGETQFNQEYIQISFLCYSFFSIPATFFHFCCNLTNSDNRLRKFIQLGYFITFLLAILNYFHLTFTGISPKLCFNYWPTAGLGFNLYIIYFTPYILASLKILYKAIPFDKDKNKLKLIFWSSIVMILGGMTNFPLWYNINIPPFGNFFVSAYFIAIGYAIIRYQFLDIKIILRKSFVYTLLVTILTLIYLISVAILEKILQIYIGYNSVFHSIITTLIVALIFIPLKNFIQNFADKLFFRETYPKIAEQNELMRQELTKADKYKSLATLASGIAHEIKNPLTSLQTFFEYYPKKKNNPEFMATFTQIAPREFERINTLVQELLDFAKPSPPQLQNCDIHTIIEECLDLLLSKIKKNNITLVENLSANLSQITIDPNQIKQALINIFLNAIEAMPNSGTLTAKTYNKNNQLLIEVTDTGCGIPPEKINHIFEPFYTTKETGTGLGLAITKTLVEKNKGKINIESKEILYTKLTIILKL